jgi:multiple sugar transport system ATP-binding protein
MVAGIRPEALRVATSAATDLSLPVEIEVVELTGPELVTTARIGAQRLTACLPPRSRLAKGETCSFAFDEAALRLFDPATGKACPGQP